MRTRKFKESLFIPEKASSRGIFDSVVQAANKLFDSLDFDSTTTNKIADKAGVSIGSLYQYFPNKEKIFTYLIDRMIEENRRVFLSVVKENSGKSMREMTASLVDVSVDTFLKRKHFLRVIFSQLHRINKVEDLLESRRLLSKEMAEVLRAQFSKEVRHENLENTLFLAMNSFMGVLEAHCMDKNPQISEAQLKAELARLLESYLLIRPMEGAQLN
jgi:AcrR family transcriptional regulator